MHPGICWALEIQGLVCESMEGSVKCMPGSGCGEPESMLDDGECFGR